MGKLRSYQKRNILILLLCLLTCWPTAAQSYSPERPIILLPGSGSAGQSGKKPILEMPKSENANSSSYKAYTDESLDELNRKMEERDWGSEDTAWIRACEKNTRQSFERYMALYPNGAHIAEAEQKLIISKITETLNNTHNELPDIKHLEVDDESLTSTVYIQNNTIYPLTVYYSGFQTKGTVIPASGSATITVENGEYKIAASVPPHHIRPYAGKTSFSGGKYEIGFWVISD